MTRPPTSIKLRLNRQRWKKKKTKKWLFSSQSGPESIDQSERRLNGYRRKGLQRSGAHAHNARWLNNICTVAVGILTLLCCLQNPEIRGCRTDIFFNKTANFLNHPRLLWGLPTLFLLRHRADLSCTANQSGWKMELSGFQLLLLTDTSQRFLLFVELQRWLTGLGLIRHYSFQMRRGKLFFSLWFPFSQSLL